MWGGLPSKTYLYSLIAIFQNIKLCVSLDTAKWQQGIREAIFPNIHLNQDINWLSTVLIDYQPAVNETLVETAYSKHDLHQV